MTNSKHKLREFQWFQMETRVRQMVQQLISPFSKRVFQSMAGINALRLLTSEQSQKLEQLRIIVTDDPMHKELNIFKEIDKKQEKLQADICELRNLVSESESLVDKRMVIQEERLEQNKQIIQNNMKLKQRVSQQILVQNQSIKQFRQQMEKIVGQTETTLSKAIKDQQEDSKGFRLSNHKLNERIDKLQEYVLTSEGKFQKNFQDHLSMGGMLINLQEELGKSNREIKALNENLIYIKKMGNYVKQLEEKLQRQDFNLQHLSPLVTQAQVSETLHNILPSRQRRKLVVFEHEKFASLNSHILDIDPKKPKDLFNGMSLLQRVQKRNTKEVIDLKRKKLISMGINIDSLNYETKEKYYKEVSLREQELSDDQDQKTTVHRDSDESHNALYKMEELISANLNARINNQIGESKRYFQQIEDQLQITLQKTTTMVTNCQHALELLKVEQSLTNSGLTMQVDMLKNTGSIHSTAISDLGKNLNAFIQFCTLVNHLLIQDQLDKQSISLFGLKDSLPRDISDQNNSQRKQPVVNMQKQCFSCNGFPATTISAFKMACLTYSPSTILLDNKQYKREELLEISTKILQHLKGLVDPPTHKFANKSVDRSANKLECTPNTQPHTEPNERTTGLSRCLEGRMKKFNTTQTREFRSRSKTKTLKSESKDRRDVMLATSLFQENRKRHSIYFTDSRPKIFE